MADTHEFGSVEEKAAAREHHVDSIISLISVALKEILGHYNVDFNDPQCQRKLRKAIADATRIGESLGELQSGLVLMDKAWFSKHTDENGHILPSVVGNRMRLLYEPDGGKVIKGKVAVVISPGLLKYGADSGEGWETWSVWTPAIVQLMDMETEVSLPSLPSPPPPLTPQVTDLPRNHYEHDGDESDLMSWTDDEVLGPDNRTGTPPASERGYQPHGQMQVDRRSPSHQQQWSLLTQFGLSPYGQASRASKSQSYPAEGPQQGGYEYTR
jgi:hypothetical protein